MLIVLLALVLIAVVVAAVLGIGPLASERSTEDRGVLGGAVAPLGIVAGGVIVLLVVAAALFGVIGVRGGSDDSPGGEVPLPELPSEPTTTTMGGPSSPSTTAVDAPAPAPAVRAALGPVVALSARDGEAADRFPRSYEVVDALEPHTVLRVRVSGFEPFATARARQCASAARMTCGNAIDVQFGAAGTASFQYLVSDDFSRAAGPGRCRAREVPCMLVVESDDFEDRAQVQTVFGERVPPPGRIRVRPARGIVDGQRVTVEVENYPPGARVQAMLCAPPAATGSERCGAPGPTAPLTVGPDGRGSTELTIRAGPVGEERVRCGRGQRCGISVASGTVFARAPVVPIAFAAPPGADYDPGRLAAGLAVAVLLLALGTWLVRRTDWSPVGEEAAPEIDDAEYADLDAIVAGLPPAETLEDLIDRTRQR